MNEKTQAIIKSLINRIYEYIMDNNIEKLTKSDKKIAQYIKRIYPRCLIDHLAAKNKEWFKEEQIDPKTGEPVKGAP